MRESGSTRWRLALGAAWLAASAVLALPCREAVAQGSWDSAVIASDGQHDFDFEIGTWMMQRRRLLHPLTGDTT